MQMLTAEIVPTRFDLTFLRKKWFEGWDGGLGFAAKIVELGTYYLRSVGIPLSLASVFGVERMSSAARFDLPVGKNASQCKLVVVEK
jgi:hypothetical protein